MKPDETSQTAAPSSACPAPTQDDRVKAYFASYRYGLSKCRFSPHAVDVALDGYVRANTSWQPRSPYAYWAHKNSEWAVDGEIRNRCRHHELAIQHCEVICELLFPSVDRRFTTQHYRLLRQALRRLPYYQRKAIWLHLAKGAKVVGLAKRLRRRANTLRSDIWRGLQTLREELAKLPEFEGYLPSTMERLPRRSDSHLSL